MKYYSEILKKLFDSEKEVKEAEELAVKKAEEKKELMETKRKERAEDAKEVENAFRAIKDAEEIYYKKLNEFIDKYGYYHYSSKDVEDFPSVFSLFKPFFNNWF